MDYKIDVFSRPGKTGIARRIKEICELLTVRWFTKNVPGDTERDLLFHDAMCLSVNGEIVSFIMFSTLDGTINITMMGTHPDYRGKGLGTAILQEFFRYVGNLGFDHIKVFTVPPDIKPSYKETLHFYEKNGFQVTKRYTELWEGGAIELTKTLKGV